MSATVDVLAVLDRLIGNARTMAGMTGDHVMRDNLRDGEKARAAVAELIAAAVGVHAACRHGKEPDLIALADALDSAGAKEARRLALASIGGAA